MTLTVEVMILVEVFVWLKPKKRLHFVTLTGICILAFVYPKLEQRLFVKIIYIFSDA